MNRLSEDAGHLIRVNALEVYCFKATLKPIDLASLYSWALANVSNAEHWLFFLNDRVFIERNKLLAFMGVLEKLCIHIEGY